MPQKRNPDAAELVRAKTGRIIGALNALLIVMKGLPLAYQKDMQEDKEGAFDALSALVAVARRDDRHGARHRARHRAHEEGGGRGLCHRDRSRRLAGARRSKLPFREAHHITGRIVAAAAEHERAAAPAAARGDAGDRAAHHRGRCSRCCRSSNSVKSRTSYGGTAPKNVRSGQALAEVARQRTRKERSG